MRHTVDLYLPATPPWIPLIESPDDAIPSEGRRKLVARGQAGGRTVEKHIVWRNIQRRKLWCGETWEHTFERRVGLSRKSSVEAKWNIKALQAELGAALNESVSLEQESKQSEKRIIKAPEGYSLIHIDWQLMEVYEVTETRTHWFSSPTVHTDVFEVALPHFDSTRLENAERGCSGGSRDPKAGDPLIIEVDGKHLIRFLAEARGREFYSRELGRVNEGDTIPRENLERAFPWLAGQHTGHAIVRRPHAHRPSSAGAPAQNEPLWPYALIGLVAGAVILTAALSRRRPSRQAQAPAASYGRSRYEDVRERTPEYRY
jgi:hypothetical protein